MRATTLLGFLTLLVATTEAQVSQSRLNAPGTLDSSDVEAAITLGRHSREWYGYRWGAYETGGFLGTTMVVGYLVFAQGPFGRVASAAARGEELRAVHCRQRACDDAIRAHGDGLP